MKTYDDVNKEVELMSTGDVMLVSVRPIEGGKLSIEFAEKISGANGLNVVAMLNQSDERFNSGRPVRAWQGAQPEDFQKLLGIDLSKYKLEEIETSNGSREVYSIGLLNPMIQGQPIKLEIRERTNVKNEWEKENLDRVIKQNGTGQYLTYKGQPIIRDVAIVTGIAEHKFVQHTDVIESLDELGYVEEVEAVDSF